MSSLYLMTGQIPMVLVPPLGGRYLPLAGNGVERADHPMRRLRRNRQTGMRLHPNRSRARHNNRVWELVRNPDLGLSDVYSRVLVGLLARQPIEADLFPGILEGLAGNLGLSPAGTVNPPCSRQEGVMRRWATALRRAAYDPSDTGQGSASSTTPLGLHLDYSMEFRSRRVGDIPPALTSSLLPSFPFLEKPRPWGTSVTSCSSTAGGN